MSRKPTPVNIRNFSVKCGLCGQYPVLASYQPGEDCNTYRFECEEASEGAGCSPILLEIPIELDEFGNRNPDWHGGKKHAGADARSQEEAEEEAPIESQEEAEQPGGLLPVLSG